MDKSLRGNNMNEDRIVDIGIILGAIAIVVLKFMNVITLSWLWVLSPLWICAGLGIILCIIAIIAYIYHDLTYKRRKEE